MNGQERLFPTVPWSSGVRMRATCVFFVIMCLQTVQNIDIGGRIEIKFSKYEYACGSCDVRFVFCLSDSSHADHVVDGCSHDMHQSRGVDVENGVANLGTMDSVGGVPNPWTIDALNFEDPVLKLIVKVRDDDTFLPQDLATWSYQWTEVPGANSQVDSWVPRVTQTSGHRLSFQTRTFCKPNFYGATCSVKCFVQDTATSHFDCDLITGARICKQGWEGSNCDVNIDECQRDFCVHGECQDSDGSYTCVCHEHYSGPNCTQLADPCYHRPCNNQGICRPHSDVYAFTCDCPQPWEGPTCATRSNPCDDNPCQNSGACVPNSDFTDYSCVCSKEEWQGKNCDEQKNPCDKIPCQNLGSCFPNSDFTDYTCVCPSDEWQGKNCDRRPNPCQPNPCLNLGSCDSNLDFSEFMCTCPPTWTGKLCETGLNYCLPTPCRNDGTCFSIPQFPFYKCECPAGWTGDHCETRRNPCDSNLCLQADSYCVPSNDLTTYECRCGDDWTGKFCEIRKDPCHSDPCQNSGTCRSSNDMTSFSCECRELWEGDRCETRRDPCEATLCQNGGTCVSHSNKLLYTCNCATEYQGLHCETRRDPCQSQPCRNGGSCQAHSARSNYTCSCPYPYAGPNCDRISTTPDRNGAVVNSQQQNQSSSGSDVGWWWIVLVVVGALVILGLILLFVRRRRSRKGKEQIVVYQNGDTPLAFDNEMYAGETAPSVARQTSRDLPAVPPAPSTPPPEPEYSELEENRGAVGGIEGDYKVMSKPSTGPGAAPAPMTNGGPGVRAGNNPYSDFNTLTRASQRRREQEEMEGEDPGYNRLDEVAEMARTLSDTPPYPSVTAAENDYEVPLDFEGPPSDVGSNHPYQGLVAPPRTDRLSPVGQGYVNPAFRGDGGRFDDGANDGEGRDREEDDDDEEEEEEEDVVQQQEDIAKLRQEVMEAREIR